MKSGDRLQTLDVAVRLRRWREAVHITRTTVAGISKVGKHVLVSYEAGRAALPWGVFRRLWETFSISPQWLATGCGNRSFSPIILDASPGGQINLAKQLAGEVSPKERFSKVYAEKLAPFFDDVARNCLAAHLTEIERFVRLAKAEKIDASAVMLVAETVRSQLPEAFATQHILLTNPEAKTA